MRVRRVRHRGGAARPEPAVTPQVTGVSWPARVGRAALAAVGVTVVDDAPDPAEVLECQLHLRRLRTEIGRLVEQPTGAAFAQGHHLVAAGRAYDLVLLDACRLARIPVDDDRPHRPHLLDDEITGGERRLDAVTRLLVEARLTACGWIW